MRVGCQVSAGVVVDGVTVTMGRGVGGLVYGWSGISRVSKILLGDIVCSSLR